MRHLKSYKLFESVITKSEFPTELDIQELFYDLTDEEPLSKCNLYESGYQFFTRKGSSNLTKSSRRIVYFFEYRFKGRNENNTFFRNQQASSFAKVLLK